MKSFDQIKVEISVVELLFYKICEYVMISCRFLIGICYKIVIEGKKGDEFYERRY